MYDIVADIDALKYINTLRSEELQKLRATLREGCPEWENAMGKIAAYGAVNITLDEILNKANKAVSLVS